jgi:PAS domain S-box-containing protein
MIQIQSNVVHAENTILYADDKFLTLVGQDSLDDVIGTSLTDFFAPKSRGVFDEYIGKLKRGEHSTIGIQTTLQTDTPQYDNIVALISPVEWDRTTRIQTSFLHIAGEQSQSGLSLRDHAMDHAPVGITIADATQPDLPLIYVNDHFLEQTGYMRDEVLGRNCRFLQGENTREESVTKMRNAIEAEQSVTVDVRNYRKDGSMFWNRVSLFPVEPSDRPVTHFLGFQQDVTDEKLYQDKKEVFEKQAEVADRAMFVTDREGVIEYVNPAFERSTGYTRSEAIGQTLAILDSSQQDDSVYEELWETVTAGDVWEGELTNETKSGVLYQAKLTVVPVVDDTGQITHFTAIERDITDTVLREQALNVLNRILRHNLRTAITVIDGQMDILESDIEGTDPRAVIKTIRNQTESMRKIADNTGMIRTLWEQNREGHTWDRSYLETLLTRYRDQYPQADITLSVDISDTVQLPNAELFELACDEAIENAVTHADVTVPDVTITVTQNDAGDRVTITVSDNGPGIPENERQTIEMGREMPLAHGTGIGLWIIEWVTINLGGEFTIEDNTPRGTTLRFELPTVDEPAHE